MKIDIYDMSNSFSFKDYVFLKEGNDNFDQPHIISADPPMKIPNGIERLAEAFKKSKTVPIGKEVDSKSGGEKDVTMKSKKLFIVGGAVRDHLLGHTPKNYNLVTDAHPDEIERILKSMNPPIQIIKKNNKEGTVKVSVDDETYTIETMKVPGSNAFTINPSEDSQRRDVTINALYYEPSTKKIYDYTGGLRHLKDGNVKLIGKAEDRIKDNGMIKYRFARMLNKVPNGKTDNATKTAISKTESEESSPEEIRDEFWRGVEDLHSNLPNYLKTYSDLGKQNQWFWRHC
jgi:hypothetical protein